MAGDISVLFTDKDPIANKFMSSGGPTILIRILGISSQIESFEEEGGGSRQNLYMCL